MYILFCGSGPVLDAGGSPKSKVTLCLRVVSPPTIGLECGFFMNPICSCSMTIVNHVTVSFNKSLGSLRW